MPDRGVLCLLRTEGWWRRRPAPKLKAGFVAGLCGGDAGPVTEQAALSFGGLLRQLRAEARLTPEELAEAAGLSPRAG